MQQAAIHDFLVRFFTVTGCELLPAPDRRMLKVRLTADMDKQLMNRPFYWHYIEKTGGVPEPAVLLLRTDKSLEKGELIHFGSPRLHQIFDLIGEMAPFIRLYQNPQPSASPALEPWLGINYKIQYHCDLQKERLVSIGLQLINGTLVGSFYQRIQRLSLTPRMPAFCYTLRPLITVGSGIGRIERLIASSLEKEDHEWAEEATARWSRDRRLLEAFYEKEDPKPESYAKEVEALNALYEPRLEIRFVSGGLFFLQSSAFLPQTS
jgi:hypothetical protein